MAKRAACPLLRDVIDQHQRALAAKEGKPLLVDFEADWCVWCKRLDYHTYPDAGVVETLGKRSVDAYTRLRRGRESERPNDDAEKRRTTHFKATESLSRSLREPASS